MKQTFSSRIMARPSGRLFPAVHCIRVFALCLLAQQGILQAQPQPERAIAAQHRGQLVTTMIAGAEHPSQVLEQLGSQPATTPRGDREAEFAFNAMDIGQRLIGRQQPALAEPFFLAAEHALGRALARTPDSEAETKVQYLNALALVRGRYLGKAVQAKHDIDEGLRLSPRNPLLLTTRRNLAATGIATPPERSQR